MAGNRETSVVRRDAGQASRRDGPRGEYDRWLLLAGVALACIGIVMVASSSIAVADAQHVGEFYFLRKHLVFLGGGVTLAWLAARTELRSLEKYALPLLMLSGVLLLLVFLPGVGIRVNGARRWINLGMIGFQPVEAVKLIFIVYLASYLVRHRESVEQKLVGLLKPLLIASGAAVLLLMQPDFGSAALIIAVTVAMVWLGGVRARFLAGLGLLLLPAAGVLALSQDYRIKRLTSFLDPWKDPFDDGFQLTQALIAIGRGEWFGVGLGASVQKLFYLPEAHTDFILAVIAEELGLVGVLVVLGLYSLLVGRGLWLGMRGVAIGQSLAGYVASGIAICIGLQAGVSIGVNLGVLPTKGLTLPLISSGGSSVLMTCAMVGVLLRASYEITRAGDARQMAVRPSLSTDAPVEALP